VKRVLVISDNEVLVEHLMKEISEQGISEFAKFDFFFSKGNRNATGLSKLGMKPISLNEESVTKKIIITYQLVLSLHCKQLFPRCIVNNIACVNFHPGFNPYNRGWYPQVFSIINKKPFGATIHVIDEFVDHGPIIVQKEVEIHSFETSLEVYEKVVELEKDLITNELSSIVAGEYTASPVSQRGNINSIEDFYNLCQLDLDSFGTLREHIDLLRATTHGSFKNAFYVEGDKKVYVRIELTLDDN